jgi:hypothetical protein
MSTASNPLNSHRLIGTAARFSRPRPQPRVGRKAHFCDGYHIAKAITALACQLPMDWWPEGRSPMTMMTASVASPSGNRMRGRAQFGWRKFLETVLETASPFVEDEIVEYLQGHRHDLPPEVWIELERRPMDT